MRDNPLISIVIPAFNSAATIVAALESIASQSLWDKNAGMDDQDVQECEAPIEVIVVDDCSIDNTVAVVDEWLRQTFATTTPSHLTSYVSRLTLPCNAGPAAARNAGIAAAKGEWIAFLDADDLWLPHHLEVLLTVAHQTGAVMVCGESVRFQDGSKLSLSSKDEEKSISRENVNSHLTSYVSHTIALEELARHNPIATSAVMVRRDVLLAIGGFDEQFRGPEDYDLWIRVAAYAQREAKSIEQKPAKIAKEELRSSAGGGEENSPLRAQRASVQYSFGRILHVAVPVSFYRQTTGSLSMDERKFLPQVLRVIEKAYGPGGALSGMPEWKNAALATQYQQASWMAFCRGERVAAVRYWVVAVGLNIAGSKRITKPWLALLCRYVFGAREVGAY